MVLRFAAASFYPMSFPVLLLTFLSAYAAASPTLVAEQVWIRLAPPEARVMAAYGHFRNVGEQPLVLVGAESEFFGAIEIHETFERDGLMRMRRIPELAIPPGGAATLAPGGLHFMLFRPTRSFAEGEEIPIRLRFAEGEAVEVLFRVRAAAPAHAAPAQGPGASARSAR